MSPRRIPPLLLVLAMLLHHGEQSVLVGAVEVVKGLVFGLGLELFEIVVALIEDLFLLFK